MLRFNTINNIRNLLPINSLIFLKNLSFKFSEKKEEKIFKLTFSGLDKFTTILKRRRNLNQLSIK